MWQKDKGQKLLLLAPAGHSRCDCGQCMVQSGYGGPIEQSSYTCRRCKVVWESPAAPAVEGSADAEGVTTGRGFWAWGRLRHRNAGPCAVCARTNAMSVAIRPAASRLCGQSSLLDPSEVDAISGSAMICGPAICEYTQLEHCRPKGFAGTRESKISQAGHGS